MNDVTPSERAAIVTLAMAQGRTLTPADVARMTECELRAGYKVLARLSRVLPLYEDAGRWGLMSLGVNVEGPR